MEYSLLAGGKRLRPGLVLETSRACARRRGVKDAEPSSAALAAAAAIELVHTFSLVHDDLPAMDDDDLRRGRPTSHKVFGEARAILAGDAMVSLAFQTLAELADGPLAAALVGELARASGPAGMIGGQVLDIAAEGRSLTMDQLHQIHRMKTGALLTAACRMGAIAASAPEADLAAITEFGRQLGIAFQIVDDLLDVSSTPEQLGKATGKDQARGKSTYPGLIGIAASQRAAADHVAAAEEALRGWGAEADGLRALAGFVTQRQA
jgi:geranylgeranyl pyrophosphate synthase